MELARAVRAMMAALRDWSQQPILNMEYAKID